MARIQKVEKIEGRTARLRRLRNPDVAGAYLAEIFREGDKKAISQAMSDIEEAYRIERPTVSKANLDELRKTATQLLRITNSFNSSNPVRTGDRSKLTLAGQARLKPTTSQSARSRR